MPEYIEEIKKLGVEIVDSIDELLKRVDCVLLETNDGRPHLEQALPVLQGRQADVHRQADRRLAGRCIAIFAAAKKYNCPMFSSSSLRYGKIDAGGPRPARLGKVTRCETSSPAQPRKDPSRLFWYGIHGVEALFTVMGTGCETVTRGKTADGKIEVIGEWVGGRIGTFREGKGYGGKATGREGRSRRRRVRRLPPADRRDRQVLPHQAAAGRAEAETLEIYAFMEAADESKRSGGAPVKLADVMAKAQPLADKRLAELDPN